MAKNTYGTGCFLLMNTGTEPQNSKHRLLTTRGMKLDRLYYALEGSVFGRRRCRAVAARWLGIIKRSADVETLAASVTDQWRVYFVPAFTGWVPPIGSAVRGTSLPFTRQHARAYCPRALEAIAFQSAELLAAMQKDARSRSLSCASMAAPQQNNLLMQFRRTCSCTVVT